MKLGFRIYQSILLILYIGLMVFFVVMCLETGTKSSESSQKVATVTAEVINTVSGEEIVSAESTSFQKFVRKFIGHFSYFVTLGLVSSLFWLSIDSMKSKRRVIIHYFLGFSFAILSEFLLEGTTTGRGPSWSDVMLDSLGFISLSTIIILVYYFLYLRLKRQEV